MAELLRIINNEMNKYRLEDIINEDVAIITPSVNDFEIIQNKIDKLYSDVRVLPNGIYGRYKENTCINIVMNKADEVCVINYCNSEWYVENNYKIIADKDIIWKGRDNSGRVVKVYK